MKHLVLLLLLTVWGNAQIWKKVSTPSGAAHIRDFAVNTTNNHWFIADRVSGDWKSTDQGNTWSQISNGLPKCTLSTGQATCAWTINYDPIHNQLITTTCSACDHGGTPGVQFFRSTDEGTTWIAITIPQPINVVSNLPGNSGGIYQNGLLINGGRWANGNSDCGTFYSTDGGVTTHPISYTLNPGVTANGCGGAYGYFYNPLTKDYWMGTEVEGVFRSLNGTNWQEVSPVHCGYGSPCFNGFGNIQSISYDSSGNVFAGAQDALYKGTGSNGSYNWVLFKNVGIPDIFRDLNGYLYIGQYNNFKSDRVSAVLRSTDQGATWSAWTTGIPTPADGNLEAWHFLYNPIDKKLYTQVQDQMDPAGAWGYVYVTINPIVGGGTVAAPPVGLQVQVH